MEHPGREAIEMRVDTVAHDLSAGQIDRHAEDRGAGMSGSSGNRGRLRPRIRRSTRHH
jgi:hypothetical protein